MKGGFRKGAGRKPGIKNKATILKETAHAELIEVARAEGIQPLEAMLGAMRAAWKAGDIDKAANIAKDAAPYVHPRLSSVEARTESTVEQTITVKQDAADEISRRITRISDRSPETESPSRH